jgi:DNA-binding response OmpR family regulator
VSQRILIVDDEEMIRLLYRKELSQGGYKVDTASSGAEAIKKASQGNFGVVVLDIELPDISGLEVLQKLRQVAPETPVILNSAYTTYKSDFQSWLADDYVVKSSDLQALKQKIQQLVVAR